MKHYCYIFKGSDISLFALFSNFFYHIHVKRVINLSICDKMAHFSQIAVHKQGGKPTNYSPNQEDVIKLNFIRDLTICKQYRRFNFEIKYIFSSLKLTIWSQSEEEEKIMLLRGAQTILVTFSPSFSRTEDYPLPSQQQKCKRKTRVLKMKLRSQPSLGVEERWSFLVTVRRSEVLRMARSGEKGIQSGAGGLSQQSEEPPQGCIKKGRPQGFLLVGDEPARVSNRLTTIHSVHPFSFFCLFGSLTMNHTDPSSGPHVWERHVFWHPQPLKHLRSQIDSWDLFRKNERTQKAVLVSYD